MITGGSKEASVFVLNLNTFKMQAKKPMNVPRDNHGLISHKKKVYALGGYCTDTNNCTMRCEEYDIENDRWKDIESMKLRRKNFGVILA